jgi:gliding motility-associated lipoprotein GldD
LRLFKNNMQFNMKYKLLILFLLTGIFSCSEKYTPKPHGYFRIDFPEKEYRLMQKNLPYHFEIPDYAQIIPDRLNPEHPDWINVLVPANKAEVHISYYSLDKNGQKRKKQLSEFMEESRRLAYKHSIKADAINEQIYMNPAKKVYGTVYKIEGNAASPMQFYLTDSTRNFLRGAFYLREVPNIDSLKPVIDFLEPDIIHLIETTTWN